MTSLSTASKIASSSLAAVQVQLSVTSSNIANADTDGYTKKTASQNSETTSGSGTGVSVSTVTSNVSRLLVEQLSEATSGTAAAEKTASYLDRLQTALGSTTSDSGSGTSLANLIADVESALSELATTPESTTLSMAAVDALDTLASEINELSSEVQSLRREADHEIASAVDGANVAIETIDELNKQIREASARGETTADLEDQRNSALVALSEYLGVTSFTASDGTMKVYTSSGQVLVDSTAHILSFTSANTVNSGTSYDGTAAGLSGVSVDGQDITDDIARGSIAALVELRDETLPAVQEALDELASGLIDSLNAVRADLLTGSDATDISINSDLLDTPADLLNGTDVSGMAIDLLDALQDDHDFSAAGDLGARSTSFADYATDILSLVVTKTNNAETKLETAQTELETVTDTIASTFGVNIDEETARLSELESLYSVSSQILSIIQNMFDDLIAAVQ
ncbi:flagellar hook-associated protein FlgK [Roseibium aggregatum]|uniref:flagellar hook-associated protein FlgK n=1 Tax=Roseibium aggregatum TaxID=187304 RepID=UPI003A9701FC